MAAHELMLAPKDPSRRVFIEGMDPGWRIAIDAALRDDEENFNWSCKDSKEAEPSPFRFQYVLRRQHTLYQWGFTWFVQRGFVQIWEVKKDLIADRKNQRLMATQFLQNQCLMSLDIIECANGREDPFQIEREIKESFLLHLRVHRPSDRDRHLFECKLLFGGWMLAKAPYDPDCEPELGYLRVQKGSPLWVYSNTVAPGDDANLYQRYVWAQISHPMRHKEKPWKHVWENGRKGWLPTDVLMLAPPSFGWG